MPIVSTIDSSKSVRLNAKIIGACASRNQSVIFDSGFNGDLVMPLEIAVVVGLESGGMTTVELADGFTQDFPIFLCDIEIGGILQKAAVIVMGNEILLGMGMMEPFRVCLQPSTSEAIIEPTEAYKNFVGMMGMITGGQNNGNV